MVAAQENEPTPRKTSDHQPEHLFAAEAPSDPLLKRTDAPAFVRIAFASATRLVVECCASICNGRPTIFDGRRVQRARSGRNACFVLSGPKSGRNAGSEISAAAQNTNASAPRSLHEFSCYLSRRAAAFSFNRAIKNLLASLAQNQKLRPFRRMAGDDDRLNRARGN